NTRMSGRVPKGAWRFGLYRDEHAAPLGCRPPTHQGAPVIGCGVNACDVLRALCATIAQIAPPHVAVPPKGCGGMERGFVELTDVPRAQPEFGLPGVRLDRSATRGQRPPLVSGTSTGLLLPWRPGARHARLQGALSVPRVARWP